MNISDSCIVMNERVIARSFAKINLTLDILGKRNNGYHDIETIMQTVNLFDLIIVDKAPKGIKLSTNISGLPTNEKNIACKAAKMFFDNAHINSGVKMLIHKNIPVGAGMAGGSSNGAAVLVAMNRLFGNPLSEERLLELGARLGADVPFCIKCGTAVATGIGEKLNCIENNPGMPIVVIKPKQGISTSEMYKIIDSAEIPDRPDTEGMLKALEEHDFKKIADKLGNVMEAPAIKKCPIIGEIKENLIKVGALGSLMTGSGSAVFGIFETKESADRAVGILSERYSNVYSLITI